MAKPRRNTGGVGASRAPNRAPKPAQRPKAPKQPKAPKLMSPPPFSYDPQIDAERRSLGRGLKDILKDTARATNFGRTDWQQQQSDLNLAQSRGYEDLDRDFGESLRDLAFRREDLTTSANRGREDFSSQLTNLIRNTQIQGREQTQAANASGVLGGSSEKAAAARRGENLAIARKPIDTGLQRLEEDYTRNMGRLAGSEAELYSGAGIARSRLAADTSREMMLGQRDWGRTKLDLGTKLRRAKREQRIGDLDLRTSAIFDARERKPGAFSMTGAPKGGARPKAPKAPVVPKRKRR